MANLSWITLKGELQGDISENCGSRNSPGNKSQTNHINQIMIYALEHETTHQQNVNHHELQMIKPVDRSSPLLNKAINDNETLECEIFLYRTPLQECRKSIIKLNYSKHIYQTLN